MYAEMTVVSKKRSMEVRHEILDRVSQGGFTFE